MRTTPPTRRTRGLALAIAAVTVAIAWVTPARASADLAPTPHGGGSLGDDLVVMEPLGEVRE